VLEAYLGVDGLIVEQVLLIHQVVDLLAGMPSPKMQRFQKIRLCLWADYQVLALLCGRITKINLKNYSSVLIINFTDRSRNVVKYFFSINLNKII